MKQYMLGKTGILVPELCLGTMTFGEQNTPAEAFAQLEYAADNGLNFWDTAEMYPVPPRAQTQGATEKIIGDWFRQSGRRKEIILASKISGPSQVGDHIRGGKTRFRTPDIKQALDDSLKRLQTDYIDLYQLHWPERQTNFFGKAGFTNAMAVQDISDLSEFTDTLEALEREIKAGRIRAIGLSNETPWATMRYLALADHMGLPRMASIQNPYNLLNRTFEIGLAEIACREKIGLLAYSPLAFGVLSGKYLNGQKPEGARLTRWERFSRYTNPQADAATAAYADIAARHHMSLAQMSLAFIRQQTFVTSTIIGATHMTQLRENIDSLKIRLSQEILDDIEAVHTAHPNPAP